MGECEEAYGILPCSSSLPGSICLIIAYGYLLLQGANMLSDGSELLLEILDPGVIGGLLLPVLGALPDSLIIIVSGLGVSREVAQEQVSVGIGTLAGSTIMLLTIAWGGSLLLGRCDLDPTTGVAQARTLTRKKDLLTTGVTTDAFTPKGASIMMISCLLYLTVQVPAFLGDIQDRRAALIGSGVCVASLIAYSAYQVFYPELQKRRIAAARQKRFHDAAMVALESHTTGHGSLIDPAGHVKKDVALHVFKSIDTDDNGFIDENELRALLAGLSISKGNEASLRSGANYWLAQMDTSQDKRITFEEFYSNLCRWASDRAQAANGSVSVPVPSQDSSLQPLIESDEGENEEEDTEEEGKEHKEPLTPGQIGRKAVLLLIAGTAVCAFFSDPMVDAVSAFSKASGIPAFFVAFAVTPFASNASELVSSFNFAARKRQKNISLTFSQVYGAVTMNNTLCLALFLLIVGVQDLPWTYTSEVLVMVGATAIMGVLGSSSQTFRSVWAVPVLLIYPLSIVAVWGFDKLFAHE